MLVFVVLAAAGCSHGDRHAASSTTSSAGEPDTVLIRSLWENYSASWTVVPSDGFTFIANHDHPSMRASKQRCTNAVVTTLQNYRETVTLVPGSVHRVDHWSLPSQAGVLHGRIYAMRVRWGFSVAGKDQSLPTGIVHAVVDNGRAQFFVRCDPPRPGTSVHDVAY
jgi:hypothetical protein